jgi:HSP20 family protein
MNNLPIERVRDARQPPPLLKETIDSLDRVRQRAFELFERRGGPPGRDMDDWLQAEREIFQVPGMQIAEKDKEYQIDLAMPGFHPRDIRVAASPNLLIVEASTADKNRRVAGRVQLEESSERRVFREIRLPGPVNVDRVAATLDDGRLEVHAPKAEQGDGRRSS